MRFIIGSFQSGGAWGCDVCQLLSPKHHVRLLNSEVLIVCSWLLVLDNRLLLVVGWVLKAAGGCILLCLSVCVLELWGAVGHVQGMLINSMHVVSVGHLGAMLVDIRHVALGWVLTLLFIVRIGCVSEAGHAVKVD